MTILRLRNLVVQFKVDGRTKEEWRTAGLVDKPERSELFDAGDRDKCALTTYGDQDGLRGKRLNFFVLKRRRRSFTVFPEGGTVVLTGVREFDRLPGVLRDFAGALGLSSPRKRANGWRMKVINGTYTGRLNPTLSRPLGAVSRRLSRYATARSEMENRGVLPFDWPSVAFRSQFFPGVRLRWNAESGGGTANVFNNGNFVLVGVTRRDRAKNISEKICAIIRGEY